MPNEMLVWVLFGFCFVCFFHDQFTASSFETPWALTMGKIIACFQVRLEDEGPPAFQPCIAFAPREQLCWEEKGQCLLSKQTKSKKTLSYGVMC